jgi:nucleoside-diphosphate-sugar epimerase
MIHGPGNKGNLNLLYKVVSKGIPWPLGAFENKRSFVSMDNLAFVISQILEKNIEPGIYNIADDQPLSTNRLIELIAESRGKQPRIWNIGKKWVHLAAKPGDVLPLPFNSERLKKLTESYVVSNTKLKKALGIQTMPVSAEEGMKETLESFK